MLENEYQTMGEVETRHWWYRALRDMVVRELAGLVSARPGLKILDSGCGTGGMLERLRTHYPEAGLHGVDLFPAAVRWTKARGFPQVTEANINHLPFAPGSMDVILSLDVLYHASVDQTLALAECHRVLKPGGTLILNLPAYDALRGRHDVAVCGARRYRPTALRSLLMEAGFEITALHAWNSWLFLPLLVRRRISLLSAAGHPGETRGDLSLPSPLVNRLLAPLCALDTRLTRLLRIPLGTSLYVLARRP